MKRSQLVLSILSTMALAVALLPATAAARRAVGASPGHGGGGWSQVWLDDFNGPAGTGVDTSVWKYNTGQGIFGTGEIETMTSSTRNVHLDGHGTSRSPRWATAGHGRR